MQIWKFPIDLLDEHISITAPKGANPIHVGIDPKTGAICVWAIVETGRALAKLKLRVYGTGHTLSSLTDERDHIGTIITPEGFVWHFFKDVE